MRRLIIYRRIAGTLYRVINHWDKIDLLFLDSNSYNKQKVQSTSAFQNNIIDVTALVKDMQTNGNNGFALTLQSETTYNVRQYVSSFNVDITRHPTLVISYH